MSLHPGTSEGNLKRLASIINYNNQVNLSPNAEYVSISQTDGEQTPQTDRDESIESYQDLTILDRHDSSWKIHEQSALLQDNFSPFQQLRKNYKCVLPQNLQSENFKLVHTSDSNAHCPDTVKTFLPYTHTSKYVEIHQAEGPSIDKDVPINVGLVLSGGPAPGGHSVIAGIFDFIKNKNKNNQFYGFIGGVDGLLKNNYKIISDKDMDEYRNLGGFNMLWTGRGKFKNDDDFSRAQEVCETHNLKGLVIIGGDGSNSNAANLAEYFSKTGCVCNVIGVPKTIDGDLKNNFIEMSFGFDTASKTYCELIGNLANDSRTAKKNYHFIRVMGRSASHLVLECALQTRPNLVFIGEEIEANNTTLKEVVEQVCNVIIKRKEAGKTFGVVLLPEGMIEFLPEMKILFSELDVVLREGEFDANKLNKSKSTWDYLPSIIQQQLLLDREATGYIQVAKIATERLLIILVANQLERFEWANQISFTPHYFGYEGRCGIPSNFDTNYCYSLGYTSGILIAHNKNGYMSTIRNLAKPFQHWTPAGTPFWQLMKINFDSTGNAFPAITRQLVRLDTQPFLVLNEVRKFWEINDCYRFPGPLQFYGPLGNVCCFTLNIPSKDMLCYDWTQSNLHTNQPSILFQNDLQNFRAKYTPDAPDVCKSMGLTSIPMDPYKNKDLFIQRQIRLHYNSLVERSNYSVLEIVEGGNVYNLPQKLGIVFLSRQSPGAMNIIWGLMERVHINEGELCAFYGLDGLIENRYLTINEHTLQPYFNSGGIELVGRSAEYSALNQEQLKNIFDVCNKHELDGLVIPGSSLALTTASHISEYLLRNSSKTCVIGIPATSSCNLKGKLIETTVGFDSSTKVYASLIGNVLSDAASMPKYWHFIRLMGRQPSHEVVECALQTHPNMVIIGEECHEKSLTLKQIVNEIANLVVKRANLGKNFGTVLIPDALISYLPHMKTLLEELSNILKEACELNQTRQAEDELINLDTYTQPTYWGLKLSPWTLALFQSLPKFMRREFLEIDVIGEMGFERLETEQLLAQMVEDELKKRKSQGYYKGHFAAVTHFFGYQGRSSLPSKFDCNLAYSYGHLAGILVQLGLNGYCCSFRGLCGPIKNWMATAVPFISLMTCLPKTSNNLEDIPDTSYYTQSKPTIMSKQVNLNGKAFKSMKESLDEWCLKDKFCNPGPMQFYGESAGYFNRTLFEEQAEYLYMIRQVEYYTLRLKDSCRFGVDSDFLKYAYATLNNLVVMQTYPDDLPSILPNLGNLQIYQNWKNQSSPPSQMVLSKGLQKSLSKDLSLNKTLNQVPIEE